MAQKVFDKDQFPLMKAFDAQAFSSEDLSPTRYSTGASNSRRSRGSNVTSWTRQSARFSRSPSRK